MLIRAGNPVFSDPDDIPFLPWGGFPFSLRLAVTQNHIANADVFLRETKGGLEGPAFLTVKDFPRPPDIAGIHANGISGVEQIADRTVSI